MFKRLKAQAAIQEVERQKVRDINTSVFISALGTLETEFNIPEFRFKYYIKSLCVTLPDGKYNVSRYLIEVYTLGCGMKKVKFL